MEPTGNIDPGEAILAVIGVRPLVTEEVERIRAPQWRQILGIENEIQKLAQALARDGLDRLPSYPEVDYDQALEAFSEPPEPGQIEAMLQDIPDAAAMPFLVTAARAYNFLRGQFPIAVERTIFGTNQLEPGTFVLGTFEGLLELVDRPLTVFNAIAAGSLTTRQAMALQTVYPTLYFEIAVEIVLACMAEKAEKPGWDPEFGRGLSVFLGVPGIDPGLPPPTRQARPPKSDRAHLIATKSDRLELEE
jgi:hypothetical protein